jgi:hypothetical protein
MVGSGRLDRSQSRRIVRLGVGWRNQRDRSQRSSELKSLTRNAGSLKDNPRDWGMVGSGWLARSLSSRIVRFGSGGRIHQFLWQRSRAVSNANRNSAARSDQKLLRTGSSNSGWFRAWVDRSYPEGIRLLL